MIKGVIFDFDNTIYNYDLCNKYALQKVFSYIVSKYSSLDINTVSKYFENITKNIKLSNNHANKFNKAIYFKQLIEKLHFQFEELDNCLNIYNNNFDFHMHVYDGIFDVLELLKENNIKIGLLSNNIFLQQYHKLKKLNILNYFDYIQTTEEIGEEKPCILTYLSLIEKMGFNKEQVIMIGDSYSHDIIPALELKMIPFLFKNDNYDVSIENKYFYFGSFMKLFNYFEDYFNTEKDLVFLSKFFGQSELNVQGQGGNISVKSNNLMLIKSSGYILGNVNSDEGFCVVNNSMCNHLLDALNTNLSLSKIFGYKTPSMETFFHSFMKKYTIHLHFTLSNLFLSSVNDNIDLFKNLNENYKIIDYYLPGLLVAQEVKKVYDENCNIYFLKNHGLIITANTCDEILNLYYKIFSFFDNLLLSKYSTELCTFDISKHIFHKFNKSIVCKTYSNIDIRYLIHMKYCFPDLAVYVYNVKQLNNLYDIDLLDSVPEIIIYNNSIYLLADNLTKMYSLIEVLNLYSQLCIKYDELNIISAHKIQNMEEEKYRKMA